MKARPSGSQSEIGRGQRSVLPLRQAEKNKLHVSRAGLLCTSKTALYTCYCMPLHLFPRHQSCSLLFHCNILEHIRGNELSAGQNGKIHPNRMNRVEVEGSCFALSGFIFQHWPVDNALSYLLCSYLPEKRKQPSRNVSLDKFVVVS